MIRPAIATPKTDAKLRRRYRQQGADAKRAGLSRDICPFDGMIKTWWQEGWDGEPPEIAKAQ